MYKSLKSISKRSDEGVQYYMASEYDQIGDALLLLRLNETPVSRLTTLFNITEMK